VERNCPSCRCPMSYVSLAERNRAETNGVMCRSCSHKGNRLSFEAKRKISLSMVGNKRTLGYKFSNESREKLRRKIVTENTREKLRERRLQQIDRLGYRGPAYNKRACLFIKKINDMMGIQLQHAENGGEIRISGYSLDGYDKEKNVVFEYDEARNHNTPIRKEKDLRRQERIVKRINPILFLRYDERNRRLYDAITNIELPVQV